MTDAEKRDAAVAELKLTTQGYLKSNGEPRPLVGAQWKKGLDLLAEIGAVAPPPPAPPAGDKLKWAPPALANVYEHVLTDATRAIAKGDGRDLRIRNTGVVRGSVSQLEAWNDISWIGGEFTGGEANASGHVMPREITGTAHFEGIKARLTVPGDFFAPRWRVPYLQIQNCDIQVTDAGSSYHSDAFQTQFSTIQELRCDRGTFRTDYQGFFVSNEPTMAGQAVPSQVGKLILSRWNFRPGPQGYPASFLFKAIPQRAGAQPLGPWELYDVWAPNDNPLYRFYPSGAWVDWAGAAYKYGCFLETRRHANGQTYPFLRFSTSADKVPSGPYVGQACGDCGIGGEGGVWLHPVNSGPPGGDFAAADVGLDYISPGYQ